MSAEQKGFLLCLYQKKCQDGKIADKRQGKQQGKQQGEQQGEQ